MAQVIPVEGIPETVPNDATPSEPKPSLFTWGVKRSITGIAEGKRTGIVLDMKAACAEFLAMTLFVILGCGIAAGNGAGSADQRHLVAAGFGLAILVLAYTIGHHSGGHINCAVTLALVLAQQVPWYQGLLNFVFQCMGSIFGAVILAAVFDCESDMTTNLGSNVIAPQFKTGQALFGEVLMTFFLCLVVFETAVNKDASCGKNACLAIGFAVYLAHLLLLPIDGCSINPTRSLGPAIVSEVRACAGTTSGFRDFWVMAVGPCLGAILAAIVQYFFIRQKDFVADKDAAPSEKEP